MRLLPVVASCGLIVAMTACSSPAAPSTPAPRATQPVVSSSEDGNVGLCHSLSIELMTLDSITVGYESGDLDRKSFNYVAASIAKGFSLLEVLHQDATLGSEVQDVRSAIEALTTDDAEPSVGDASALGRARSVIADACESAGAPLSAYQ